MLHIQVPATSANLGPGFDCIGMAFQLYNHLWIERSHQELEIVFQGGSVHDTLGKQSLPQDKSNLIYRTICDFYQKLLPGQAVPGIKIIQEDHIPPTRGLGSSAACVVGGLLAANELSGLGLSLEALVSLAAGIEGHPDNSTPALVGGVTTGVMMEAENGGDNVMEYIKLSIPRLSELHFAVLIPDFPLSTAKARKVLPSSYSRKDVVFNASRTALLTAALIQGDFDKLSAAMDDRIHQPYRSSLIPHMDGICEQSKLLGAQAVFLSGAGPTLIAVIPDGRQEGFKNEISAYLKQLPQAWEFQYLTPDLTGAFVEHE